MIQTRNATYFARAVEARAFAYSYITMIFIATVGINSFVSRLHSSITTVLTDANALQLRMTRIQQQDSNQTHSQHKRLQLAVVKCKRPYVLERRKPTAAPITQLLLFLSQQMLRSLKTYYYNCLGTDCKAVTFYSNSL